MKNRIKYLVLVSIASVSVYAQPGKVKDADKKYNDYDYVDAIKTYEKVFEKGYKSPEMLQKLGNSYYFKADLDNAAKWYSELFALPQTPPTEYYYRYAQSLKAVKDYKKADEIMAQFIEKNKADLRAVYADGQKNYLDIIKLNSGRYEIENAGINSEKSDYGSAYLDNKVIFASARDTFGVGNRKHDWTGESFTNLYSADMGEGGVLSSADKFGNKLNSKFHESTPVFTKDGKTVYFTRDNYNGKRKYDSKKTTLLKIYKATLEGDTWSNIKELPFNSDQYSTAHPALSADEKTLYFASDMPGTLGQSDLFKVAITGDDSYGTPENLGKTINTEGRETFPFITPQNELYFASDGHPGLGGLDIFYTKLGNSNSQVINVGEPLNSSKDDFGFLIDTKTDIGYVTSNRDGGMGSDDIYRFKQLQKIKTPCTQELSGVVTDEITGEPLGGAKVTLSDENEKYIKETIADKDGKYNFGTVDCGVKVNVKAEKEGYSTVENPVIIPNVTGKTEAPIKPGKGKTGSDKIVEGKTNLAEILGIKMIYFDLDKSYIRPDAAVELAKILYVMEQHPTMEIDVRSHTDCRNSYAYNMALSDRRAKSTIAWLVQHGISASRLTGRGYGESQLTNNCPCEPTNQSSCTEAEHQANRRSEFIIMKK